MSVLSLYNQFLYFIFVHNILFLRPWLLHFLTRAQFTYAASMKFDAPVFEGPIF